MKNKLVLMAFILLAAASTLAGQRSGRNITITGYVVDENYQPVSGVVVMTNDTEAKVISTKDGFYRMRIKPSEQTILSAAYFTPDGEPITVEQPFAGNPRINFTLPVSILDLQAYKDFLGARERKVDIGYSSINKRDLTGSVSSLDNRNSRYGVYTSIYEMLREVPGVMVRGSDIQVHGPTSRNLSTQPLFIVDGNYANTISHISPITVKSVEVLKGSSASIYGVRGANGVIIINTITNPE